MDILAKRLFSGTAVFPCRCLWDTLYFLRLFRMENIFTWSIELRRNQMMMHKVLAVLLALSLLITGLLPCAALAAASKTSVVTTIFPIYDWVRQIVGENSALVEITMLLDNGVDLHSYQPSAQDILKIATADLFVYVGGESDGWVEDVLKSANNPRLKTVNLLEALGDRVKAEEIVEGMEHEHDHEDEEEHDHEHEEDHDHEEHDHDHEEEEADEHVWLSLRNAQYLVKILADSLAEADAARADSYLANAAAYNEKLAALDAEYAAAVENAAYKTILFGDRFPFRYLADDYGLTYFAAFSGCSAESEASFATIVFLAQKVDELGLPAVLTIENPKMRIAETIVSTTKAKNQKILSMDSMQGITSRDVQAGAAYLAIMENNLQVLIDALN